MSATLDAPQAAAVKKKASGSSFYLAMRLMPEAEREAMFAIYAFCRKVDDIADDGVGTREERRRKIDTWRDDHVLAQASSQKGESGHPRRVGKGDSHVQAGYVDKGKA